MQFKATASSALGRMLLLSLLPIMCLVLLRIVEAVNPPPDGGYPGGNTAEGTDAMLKLTTGNNNTAVGSRALYENLTGSRNAAVGSLALKDNLGSGHTATGFQALYTNKRGNNNTANGYKALTALAGVWTANTAMGSNALDKLSGGDSNIAVGSRAGTNLTNGSSNVYIGNNGLAAENLTTRIGGPQHARTFIRGIRGAAVSGNPVVVNAQGQLGTLPSSLRFKREIKPMGNASEALFALQPVTFRYKKDIDPENTPQFGLVAEDVEKVNPDLVLRDKEGKPYSVRYDQVNGMVLNEFLKAHREMEEQEAIIGRQEKQIEALSADLHKVSAQFEMSKAAPQTVLNNR